MSATALQVVLTISYRYEYVPDALDRVAMIAAHAVASVRMPKVLRRGGRMQATAGFAAVKYRLVSLQN